MSINVAVNGFGRIGRLVLRCLMKSDGTNVIAINTHADAKTIAYLLKYDSVHGRYDGTISHGDDHLIVDGHKIRLFCEESPAQLPWKFLGIDQVVECTGRFNDVESARQHLQAGADKVILCAPVKGKTDVPMIVMGVNDGVLEAADRVISNASCTTNCLAPMIKVLNDAFEVENGLMTTIHAYTRDQSLVDSSHSDLRRGRAAGLSLVPTSTGAAKAIGRVIPELDGKLDGIAVRVPTASGSYVDLVANVRAPATKAAVNKAFQRAAGNGLGGILEYTEDPLVSADIIGNPHSCIFDAPSTIVTGEHLVKICGWYDNEWGYANRCVDLIELVATLGLAAGIPWRYCEPKQMRMSA